MRRSKKKTSGECAAGERDSPESSVEGNKEQEPNKEQELNKEQEPNPIKIILSAFLKLGILCLTIVLLFSFAFGIAQVKGQTMYPSIRDGDLMLYYRLQSDYDIGDVVTFKIGEYRRNARIVAKGGDVVEVNDNGQLLVNGNVQQEEIFYSTDSLTDGVTYPYTVEEDSYFVLGDYRTVSIDSRSYGAVSNKDIDGKVITIFRRRGI
jgi:signal peptidase I